MQTRSGNKLLSPRDRAENLTANVLRRDEEVSHVNLDKWPDVITLPVGGSPVPSVVPNATCE